MLMKNIPSALSHLTAQPALTDRDLATITGGRGTPTPDFTQNPLDPDTDLPDGQATQLEGVPNFKTRDDDFRAQF